MLRIKQLYIYILKSFLPVFAMTFGICLFLVLMQFLWKHIEDLVGKGLDPLVLGELFFYAALNLVPLALPLAILLASIMSFGSLGESLELLAVKAAGVSLIKVMRPLIILVVCISISAFFFQNDAIPYINVKFATLLRSVKMKSPELDIPEGAFYNEIDNYSLYVKTKDKETKMMRDVMIYDTSKGFNNMAVIVCDSAKLQTAASKDFLKLNLYHGQQFANFNQSNRSHSSNNKFVSYSRENFKEKEIIITFDANFNRLDESMMEGSQMSKNIYELKSSIDSISSVIDSMNRDDRKMMIEHTYLTYRNNSKLKQDTVLQTKAVPIIRFDSLLNTFSKADKIDIYRNAMSQAENNESDLYVRSGFKVQTQRNMRSHMTEFHRKFTLSFACLIFFFIGAPLGAIIRKGGLGMPIVVSVILFIIYYIIDNVGYKMARDGVWEAWAGVWLSSFILFPLGAFLTYKANNDSALFKPESYNKFIKKVLFIKTPQRISEEQRETIYQRLPAISDLNVEPELLSSLNRMEDNTLKDVFENWKIYNYDENAQLAAFVILRKRGVGVNDLIDSQDYKFYNQNLEEYSRSSILTIIFYFALVLVAILSLVWSFVSDNSIELYIAVPYFGLFLRSISYYMNFMGLMNRKQRIIHRIIAVFSFFLYPFMYLIMRKRMEKLINKIQVISFIN